MVIGNCIVLHVNRLQKEGIPDDAVWKKDSVVWKNGSRTERVFKGGGNDRYPCP